MTPISALPPRRPQISETECKIIIKLYEGGDTVPSLAKMWNRSERAIRYTLSGSSSKSEGSQMYRDSIGGERGFNFAKHSNEVKSLIFKLSDEGKAVKEISKVVGIPSSTVYQYIRKYRYSKKQDISALSLVSRGTK